MEFFEDVKNFEKIEDVPEEYRPYVQSVIENNKHLYGVIYFRNAEDSGTPFTHIGARELRRLGILMIVIPTGCAVLAEIVQGIMIGFMNVMADKWSDLNFDNEASIIVGIMFIVGSFICGYGAEVLESRNKAQEQRVYTSGGSNI